jgi:hypothetical protein
MLLGCPVSRDDGQHLPGLSLAACLADSQRPRRLGGTEGLFALRDSVCWKLKSDLRTAHVLQITTAAYRTLAGTGQARPAGTTAGRRTSRSTRNVMYGHGMCQQEKRESSPR